MKKTTEQCIIDFTKNHGNLYDYSLVKYKGNKVKVKIICDVHGVFEQTPNHHLKGRGCPGCKTDNHIKRISMSGDTFIIKSNIKHDDRYNYSLVDYKDCRTKIKIICSEHGMFEQVPYYHIAGNGCPKCGIKYNIQSSLLSLDQFIIKSNIKHGNLYDYSLVEYKDNKSKIKIICPDHDIFEQTPNNHMRGHGCPYCYNKISKPEIELSTFISSIYNGKVINNTRKIIKPYELDVYLPELQLSFEFNGNYWHEEGVRKPIGYHQMKTDMCINSGIELIHVWEKDWKDDNRFMKETIKRKINEYIR